MSITELFLAISILTGMAFLRIGVPLIITLLIKQVVLKFVPANTQTIAPQL